ncbi:MAG TPA: ABC transporter substrate-binding protein [Stellaceae bacterium]|nr:ABC transporter substrate-binding protein [Stellaceae bacterium]
MLPPSLRALRPALLALPLAVAGAAALAGEIPRDTVVMAKRIDDIVSLDPAEAYELSDEEVIGNLYDRLLDYDPAHPADIRGDLASSWSVDEDGRTYTFRLRPDARFASGAPVTAEDVAFSLRRAVRLELTPAFVLQQFGLSRDDVGERIRAPDAETVVIETATRLAPSLLYYCLTATVGSIVERAQVLAHERDGDLGHAWLAFHSAGSGPYRLKTWRPGERYTLDAVPGSWRGAPKNREIIVLDVKEPATQRLLVTHGDADYARDLDKDQIDALAKDSRIVFDRALQTMLTYLALNQRNPYLRRKPVIEALKYLVDYDGIVAGLLGGTRIVHQAFLPDGIVGASDELPFRYEPERAKALLRTADLPDGFAVSLDVAAASPALDIAQALQASFARAGIRVTILPGDDKETLTKYRARRHELYLGNWGTDYPDPESNAQAFLVDDDESEGAAVKTLAWRNSWQDPDLAQRVAAAAQASDIDRRAALYRALQRDAQREAPYVMLFQDVAVAAHRRGIDGLVLGASPDRTRYAGIEKR